jgi:regulator of sigma E protease
MLLNIIIFIIVLSILIISHELGHFIAARRAGVRVERFAIGFGPPLIKLKLKSTLLLICLIPLGGYVKLSGDTPSELKGRDDEFLSKSVGIRARIVFFGPLFNFILALFIFWVIFVIAGVPSPEPLVGKVIKYRYVAKSKFSPQQLSRLKEAGLIQEEGGSQKYVVWTISSLQKEQLKTMGFGEIEIERIWYIWQNSPKLTPKESFSEEQLDSLLHKNIVTQKLVWWTVSDEEELKSKLSGLKEQDYNEILQILRESRYPAYKAGLKEGDLILEVDGKRVDTWDEMSRLIKESQGSLSLVVLREGEKKKISISPLRITTQDLYGKEKEISIIGIQSKTLKRNIILSFARASQKLYTLTHSIIKGLFYLVTRKIPFREAVAGPIGIGILTTKIARIGFFALFDFIGILSLSLGIINLAPFPVLDGGHLLFMVVEKLRGKALSQKWENIITQVGLAVLISLMLFVSYNDILRFSLRANYLTQEQLERLRDNGMIKEVEDDARFVFWRYSLEDKLKSRLHEVGIHDIESILSIWRDSPRVSQAES